MTNNEFWKIIEVARAAAEDDLEARVSGLGNHLSRLTLGEVQGFQHEYDKMIHVANRWDLWGAAYLMNGGCSDDGFRYFCHWLISEGKERFEAAIADPDSLADPPQRDYFELELFAYEALKVYRNMGGGEIERDFTIELSNPIGEEWLEEDLPERFPRLSEKYKT